MFMEATFAAERNCGANVPVSKGFASELGVEHSANTLGPHAEGPGCGFASELGADHSANALAPHAEGPGFDS